MQDGSILAKANNGRLHTLPLLYLFLQGPSDKTLRYFNSIIYAGIVIYFKKFFPSEVNDLAMAISIILGIYTITC